MTYLETRASRTVTAGICPVEITLAGDVYAGDCLGYSSGWKLSASADSIHPLLVAGGDGASGDRIQAFPMAVVNVTVSTAATLGEIVALNDSGVQIVDTALFPDVGYMVDADTAILAPMIQQLDTPRT